MIVPVHSPGYVVQIRDRQGDWMIIHWCASLEASRDWCNEYVADCRICRLEVVK